MKIITALELKTLIENGENPCVLDVRQADEITEMPLVGVSGVVNIPLQELADRLIEIPKNRDVIVSCRSGMRSQKSCEILEENGFTNIINFSGGAIGWEKFRKE